MAEFEQAVAFESFFLCCHCKIIWPSFAVTKAKMCQGHCGTEIELFKYLGRAMYLMFSYCVHPLQKHTVSGFKKRIKSQLPVTVLFSSSIIIAFTSRTQPSYFYLEDYLPQTLGLVVYILFSFFDISERDTSPKSEFSRPQNQALIMDMIEKWFKLKGVLEFVGN